MSTLTICKASAGSGKTHKLTGEYLKLVFNPEIKFRNVLAVTFTNKATAEMKNRILEDEFTIDDEDIEPEKIPLPAGRYRCQYVVTDIIGRKTGSDYCIFEITDGDEGRQVQLTEIQKKTE